MVAKKKAKKKMAKKSGTQKMSAAELRAMADKIDATEAAEKAAADKAEIDALKEKRKTLIAKHTKAINAIDGKIKKLGGKTAKKTRRKSNGKSASGAILAFIGSAGSASTKDIKATLDKKGISTANLNQTLAYLKRQGKIQSPSRAMYKLK